VSAAAVVNCQSTLLRIDSPFDVAVRFADFEKTVVLGNVRRRIGVKLHGTDYNTGMAGIRQGKAMPHIRLVRKLTYPSSPQKRESRHKGI
jgi:hypothetical protein